MEHRLSCQSLGHPCRLPPKKKNVFLGFTFMIAWKSQLSMFPNVVESSRHGCLMVIKYLAKLCAGPVSQYINHAFHPHALCRLGLLQALIKEPALQQEPIRGVIYAIIGCWENRHPVMEKPYHTRHGDPGIELLPFRCCILDRR